jgi:type I restriction enzyme S subunit
MVNRSKEKISDLGLASSGAKLHPPGTILMTSRASIGFAAIAAEEICTNQGFQSLRCGSDLDNWFALHQIRHRRAELQQLAAGSTFLEVSGSNVRSLPFVVPPLPEQKKIAEILSGIDNTTKAFFKKKKKNDLILRQVIIDATTPNHGSSWHESTIGDVVEFQGGAQPPRSTFKFAPEAGYIRMLQIRDYKSDARATYIPLDLCKRFCDREDVMIGRYGPPNFQILRGKEGSYNVALIKAMPKDSVVLSKDYLYRFLQRGDLFVLMDTLSQRTSGQQGLDMDALKGFPMFIPDLATQEYICRSISAIESISLGLNARVQSLNHLKSGISGQLLSGRKRVSV